VLVKIRIRRSGAIMLENIQQNFIARGYLFTIVTIPRIGFRMGDVNINIQLQEEAQTAARVAYVR
jgi:DNA-binding winged helix-turn-helix (wHTH) protein